jgi:toxin YoeB
MIKWSKNAWTDYCYWQETDKKIVKRMNVLLQEILRHPFVGIGNPEPLRHDYQGFWSRRITQEHRLVYRVDEDGFYIMQCRLHYQ